MSDVPRIGGPPPSMPPITSPRKSPRELLGMSFEELDQHLQGECYRACEEMMNYVTAVRDAMMLRQDIERRERTDIPNWKRTDVHTYGMDELDRVYNLWLEQGGPVKQMG